MVQVTYLTIGIRHSAYNSRVYKALESAGVSYKLESTKYGKRVMVEEADETRATKAVLSVPLARKFS